MRFVENGPSIPDELLLARDAGNVLFFCGAGVSRAQADLPDFAKLARDVLDLLGSATDSPARRLIEAAATAEQAAKVKGLVAFDRVFGMLEREFEASDVREAVSIALKPPPKCGLDAHRTLLDLSRARGGLVRIVTTNFDRLFEACGPDLRSSYPPQLPDPGREGDFHGIIHLHGVVDAEYRRACGDEFVLSSADFGHAYLSDGWATRYIQALLQRYKIVFVGYSADDPPVQYLLEALSRSGRPRHALYAFQSGDREQAAQQWAHKGVEPITYDSSNGHAPLWDTLARWADRARDLDGWYDRVIEGAALGPAAMAPHERGIVANLAGNLTGSRHIASNGIVLPADWLFVFDRNERYGNPERNEDGEPSRFDPFEAFGLDSDPLPEPPDPENIYLQRAAPDVWDGMIATHGDLQALPEAATARFRIRAGDVPALPPRLANLGRWIVRIANQPATLWWAAKQIPFHPHVLDDLERSLRIDSGRYSPVVRAGWRLLLRSWKRSTRDTDVGQYAIEQDAQADGWSPEIVRHAMALYRPFLKVEASMRKRAPEQSDSLELEDVIQVDVEYPRPHQPLQIPPESLALAVTLFRQQLQEGLQLEDELGHRDTMYIEPITNSSDDEQNGFHSDVRAHLITLASMVSRLVDFDQGVASAEVARWDANDPTFARLRIWAAGQPALTSGEDAGHTFLALDDRSFWTHANQTDLLQALKNRWLQLPSPTVVLLEERLCSGHYPFDDDQPDREIVVARYRLDRIQWLATHGVSLSADRLPAIAALRSLASDWTEDSARDAVQPMVSGPRILGTDNSSSALDRLPLGEIVEKAKDLGGYRFAEGVILRPFNGLARARPARALSAITVAGKNGIFDPSAWRTLLYVETETSPGLLRAIAHRLARLPAAHLAELADPAADWLCRNFQQLSAGTPLARDALWVAILAAVKDGPMNVSVNSKRSWADRSMRNSVGRMVDTWFKYPGLQSATPETGLPGVWLRRLEHLLAMPGDYRQYAIVMIAGRMNWLFSVAKDWTMQHILPLAVQPIDNDDGRAFWSGYFWRNNNPQPVLFREIRGSLVSLACRSALRREEAGRLANILLLAWGYGDLSRDPGEYLSDSELREVLIHAKEEFRTSTLRCLKQLAQVPDSPFPGKLHGFLLRVWPRQKALRLPELSEKLVDLVTSVPDQLVDLVKVVVPRLVPLRGHSIVLYDPKITEKLVGTSPRSLLDLMLAILDEDSANWPFSAGAILRQLSEQEATKDDPQLAMLMRIEQRRLI
ncbi:SIR2 family protein [Caballeronia sp. SEWSISQ10-4 2]|uniref:SIR2 family protein n=1 Tax=Caballeronia sp. SEWSISQ10-4 2 TaxID=2937438 RepID=UPI00264A7AD3|nr:SIR2 family protein [Caballeronia sp. SEWSISQ10-4 2]MDN7176984.1 SIR2 family protein [Caballeronia sp. SEWSISQ10-4 2]